jgi:hypothetical protein
MEKTLTIELYGMEFEVLVGYEQEGNKCGVTEVLEVSGVMKNNRSVALKCDKSAFEKAFEGELQEALEQAIIDDKTAYYEAKYDEARDEGKL